MSYVGCERHLRGGGGGGGGCLDREPNVALFAVTKTSVLGVCVCVCVRVCVCVCACVCVCVCGMCVCDLLAIAYSYSECGVHTPYYARKQAFTTSYA